MTAPIISKEPIAPELMKRKISDLTEVVFGEKKEPVKCDALFVFSGTHPGHWEKAIEAYEKYSCKKIIVTGGRSKTGRPHPDWEAHSTEAEVIISQLLKAGIPLEDIVFENRSSNSLENVLFAKEVFDFTKVESLMYICKSHTAGRQGRTLMKQLGEHLDITPFSFDAEYNGIPITREAWSLTETGRNRVWGEFLRILKYGEAGDILPLRN